MTNKENKTLREISIENKIIAIRNFTSGVGTTALGLFLFLGFPLAITYTDITRSSRRMWPIEMEYVEISKTTKEDREYVKFLDGTSDIIITEKRLANSGKIIQRNDIANKKITVDNGKWSKRHFWEKFATTCLIVTVLFFVLAYCIGTILKFETGDESKNSKI
jgi:hypothetical protein